MDVGRAAAAAAGWLVRVANAKELGDELALLHEVLRASNHG